jgi:hypothetical protein
MAVQQKFNRANVPTKDQLREMLAQAVRNTQPELNAAPVSSKKIKRRTRNRA